MLYSRTVQIHRLKVGGQNQARDSQVKHPHPIYTPGRLAYDKGCTLSRERNRVKPSNVSSIEIHSMHNFWLESKVGGRNAYRTPW